MVRNQAPHIRAAVGFFIGDRLKGAGALPARQLAGDRLESLKRLGAADLPLAWTCSLGSGGACRVSVLEQICPAQAAQRGDLTLRGIRGIRGLSKVWRACCKREASCHADCVKTQSKSGETAHAKSSSVSHAGASGFTDSIALIYLEPFAYAAHARGVQSKCLLTQKQHGPTTHSRDPATPTDSEIARGKTGVRNVWERN